MSESSTVGPVRCNVGCGQSPTSGWRNFDNSASLILARHPFLAAFLHRARILDDAQFAFIQFGRQNTLEYADAVAGLPLEAATVDALYSSHMFEHLDPMEASAFLSEARRVLKRGGVLRLAVPDLLKLVQAYESSGDADRFVESTYLAQSRPRGLFPRLKSLLVGARNHLWMYDGRSLSGLLSRHGFQDVRVMPPGETMISDAGGLNLFEKADESVYVEGRNG